MSKTDIHKTLCDELHQLYVAKNHDYGDSFAKTRAVVPNAILVRLHDKLNRLTTLMTGADAQVKDESIDDSLRDLANYALLELTERAYDKSQRCQAGTEAVDESRRPGFAEFVRERDFSSIEEAKQAYSRAAEFGEYVLQQIGAEETDKIWINADEDGLHLKRLPIKYCKYLWNTQCMGQKDMPECTPNAGYCPMKGKDETK